MAKIGTDIEYAASLLREGKLIGIPTDTVYGLAGNALCENSLAEIYKVKNRPLSSPILTQIDSINHVDSLVENIPPAAKKLANKFWPGALTMAMNAKEGIPSSVTRNQKTVGIRIPNHKMALSLLKTVSFPLAVTSANLHGMASPKLASEVNKQIGNQIEYILDGGICSVGQESTIIGFDDEGRPMILRDGAISKEEIEQTLSI